jgi:hypothetical protein
MRTSFLFDPEQESPESLARRRELAEAILQRSAGSAPSNVGEGLSAIGQALGARIALNRVGKAEAAGRSKALESFNSIFGGGATPATAPTPGGNSSYRDAIAKIESGGRYDAVGPTHPKMGRALGKYQVMEANVGPWSRQVLGREVSADEFLRTPELQDAIFDGIFNGYVEKFGPEGAAQAWFGGPGGVGKTGRKDSLGTSIGKYGQMFMSQIGGRTPQPIADPAMLDARRAPPSTGASPAEFMDTRPGQVGTGVDPQSFRQPVQLASADPNFNYAPQAPIQPRQRVADAMMSNAQPAARPTQIAQAQGFDPRILEALSNPYLPEGHKRVLGAMLEQKMKQMYPDPAAALDMEYKRAQMGDIGSDNARADRELELQQQKFALEREGAMLDMELKRNPQMSPYERAQIEQRQRELEAQSAKLVEMSPGTTMFDPKTREPIYTAPRAETPPPAGIQEYEYAKQQGFAGTFQDWEASKRGGMAFQTNPDGTVSFQQGANIKPLTEGQSKDTVFATRAAGALPLIDQFGDALTSLGESVGGQAPIVGNYLKSEQYQQAENAGLEFLQAILRKDTGAAITAEEQEEYGKVYLPRPGDKPALLAQKKAARQRALEAIKAGMPPQALLYLENALKQAGGAPEAAPAAQPAAPVQPAPEGSDMPPAPEGVPPNEWPTMWQMMTPEERALWLN